MRNYSYNVTEFTFKNNKPQLLFSHVHKKFNKAGYYKSNDNFDMSLLFEMKVEKIEIT